MPPKKTEQDRAGALLERALWLVKTTVTLTLYFSVCVLIIMLIIGARP